MANWNSTKLTCNDLQKFTEIMKTNPFNGPHTAQAYEDKPVEINKDGIVYMQSRNTIPDEEIKKLSKENPDLIFTAEFSFESNWDSIIHAVEYKNGEAKELDQRVNYGLITSGSGSGIPGDHYKLLIDRAEDIFRRMDTIEYGGKNVIQFINEEVTLKVEDNDYQIKLSKKGWQIEIEECFKKEKVTTLKLVKINNSDSPF